MSTGCRCCVGVSISVGVSVGLNDRDWETMVVVQKKVIGCALSLHIALLLLVTRQMPYEVVGTRCVSNQY